MEYIQKVFYVIFFFIFIYNLMWIIGYLINNYDGLIFGNKPIINLLLIKFRLIKFYWKLRFKIHKYYKFNN